MREGGNEGGREGMREGEGKRGGGNGSHDTLCVHPYTILALCPPT